MIIEFRSFPSNKGLSIKKTGTVNDANFYCNYEMWIIFQSFLRKIKSPNIYENEIGFTLFDRLSHDLQIECTACLAYINTVYLYLVSRSRLSFKV